MRPSVSAVVVNWNSGSHLQACLDALHAHAQGGDWDVTVVDNGSSDGSERCAERHGAACRLIRNVRNRGYGAAVNQAAAATEGDLVLALNPDCRIESGAVETLAAALRRHDGCAAAGPQVLDDDGAPQGSARGDPDVWTGMFGRSSVLTRLLPGSRPARRNVRDTALAAAGRDGAVVDWVSGACMLLRRRAFDAVGGFDERYFLYWEDADLCRRLREAGWHVRYVPEARVRHAAGASSRKDPRSAARAFHESAFIYYATHVARGRWSPKRWLAWTALRLRCAWKLGLLTARGGASRRTEMN